MSAIENYKSIDNILARKTVFGYMGKRLPLWLHRQLSTKRMILSNVFSPAARTTPWCIPTVYEGWGIAGIAFDENARHLLDCAFENGLIIDIAAAEILHSKGVDVGIENFGDMVKAGDEKFLKNGNKILTGGISVCDIKLNAKAGRNR